jgi:integrase
MINTPSSTLQNLMGVKLKQRVQHPDVRERKDRSQPYWFFRYRVDEVLGTGEVKTRRKCYIIGPSSGDNAMSKKQAQVERDKILIEQNAAPGRCEAAVKMTQPSQTSDLTVGTLIELWRRDYVENPMVKLAQPTRDKYASRLDVHILRQWKDARLADLDDSKAVLDWLQQECTSWHMMKDLRSVMSGIITRAKEWNVIPRSYSNPMQWVKIGKKWTVRENRIPSYEETAAIFEQLEDQNLLAAETIQDTGARISEVTGLQLKHFDSERNTIRITQRHCRGDVDEPKTENSKRTLALGALGHRFREFITANDITCPDDWIFFQKSDRSKPMWDSGVRIAIKRAAKEAGCDFPGLGPHSFRRANITMRQEVGASAIEASKIAGHATVSQTGDYTVVQLKRQQETTLAIQSRRAKAIAEYREKRKQTMMTVDAGNHYHQAAVATSMVGPLRESA